MEAKSIDERVGSESVHNFYEYFLNSYKALVAALPCLHLIGPRSEEIAVTRKSALATAGV